MVGTSRIRLIKLLITLALAVWVMIFLVAPGWQSMQREVVLPQAPIGIVGLTLVNVRADTKVAMTLAHQTYRLQRTPTSALT